MMNLKETLVVMMTIHAAEIMFGMAQRSSCVTQIAVTNQATADAPPPSISSHNFPNNYDDDTDCVWILQTTPGKQIRVTFIEASTEACCDVIEIRNGKSDSAPLLGVLRGEVKSLSTFYSTFQSLYVRFKTDHSVTAGGFLFSYDAVTGERRISLQATSSTRAITSPNFPFAYNNDTLVTWTVTSRDRSEQILLQFFPFETETCCDYVTVYDVINDDYKALASLRGQYRQVINLRSTGRQIVIAFASDSTVSRRGFRALFRSVPAERVKTRTPQPNCDAELVVPDVGHEELTNPSHPEGGYFDEETCVWTIRASRRYQRIRLWFPFVHTEKCCDWIVIKDGESAHAPKLGTVSGFPKNYPVFTSSAGVIRVEFTSDHLNSGRGFRAVYEISRDDDAATSQCGGDLTAAGHLQYFSSSNWPHANYNAGETCIWTIRSPGRNNIALTIISIATEPNYDVLTVLDGGASSDRSVLQIAGRYIVRVHVLSNKPLLTVRFAANGNRVTAAGFRASYKAVFSVSDYLRALQQKGRVDVRRWSGNRVISRV